MFDSIYLADLPRRQSRGLEHAYKSLLYSHLCGQEVPGLSSGQTHVKTLSEKITESVKF